MAPHSSTLAWKIPQTEEPGRLQSMGLRRVRHDWATSLSLFTFINWRRKWQTLSTVLAWRIPGMGEPGGLRSMGSHRVRHDWSDLAAAAAHMNPPWVYISSQSWTPLPPPSPYHLSGSSQCTSPKHPVSCIEPRLVIRFLRIRFLVYMFQCHSPNSSHPLPLPQSPKVCPGIVWYTHF